MAEDIPDTIVFEFNIPQVNEPIKIPQNKYIKYLLDPYTISTKLPKEYKEIILQIKCNKLK